MVIKIKNKDVLIDVEDYGLIEQFTYNINTNGYVVRAVGKISIPLTNDILCETLLAMPSGAVVDHKNNNPLDCRRSNLRLATPAQNAQNSARVAGTSGFRTNVEHASRG